MIFTKGAHQSTKIQTFDCSGENSPNLYFDKLLLLKVYESIFQLKKYRGVIYIYYIYIYVMILKNDTNFEEKQICCFKNEKNLVNFDPSTQV